MSKVTTSFLLYGNPQYMEGGVAFSTSLQIVAAAQLRMVYFPYTH